jgi:hypothetical protein
MNCIDCPELNDINSFLEIMIEKVLEEVYWDQKEESSNDFIVKLKDSKSFKIFYKYYNKELFYTVEKV